MAKNNINEIVNKYRNAGWIPEPEAKNIFKMKNLNVPDFKWAKTSDEAVKYASKKYPVAAKVVSPDILHKSDVGGVVVGIDSDEQMKQVFDDFSKLKGFDGVHIEEMVEGIELIIGAKIDHQFGPVVLMGIGGTSVEIYQDVAMRMAPLREKDVISMVDSLKGQKILKGYRGSDPINMRELTTLLINFSNLIIELQDDIESIDLNPVMCSAKDCVIADARIMLNTK
ncbi:MAG: acetate--CoA ligase family protein [Spirochaetes bacterium]|nr:acetate--CoA ligase family protein [Spirochaetota bacterium]